MDQINETQDKAYPTIPDSQGHFFASAADEAAGKKQRQYPSPPDADGFFTETEEDDAMEIFTKVYGNGNKVKKTILPASKDEAIVRELIGKDTKEVARFMDKDLERYQMASITACATIAGIRQPFEFFERMKMKDYNKLLSMCQDLNF